MSGKIPTQRFIDTLEITETQPLKSPDRKKWTADNGQGPGHVKRNAASSGDKGERQL